MTSFLPDPEIIPPPEKPKRPSEFTDEIFIKICERMTEGEGLREICRDPEMPSRTTFLRWLEKDTGRQAAYQRAREGLMDWYAEEILDIAWDSSKDTIPATKTKPARCDNEWVQRSRLKVDTLKFLMSKLYPKRYGDRLPETEQAEIIKAERMTISWEEPTVIKRIIVNPIRDADGNLIDSDGALRNRILELEEMLGIAEPKRLTWDPGPLPSRMDGEIVEKLVGLIKQNIPQADQRPPEEVLSEVMAECAKALQAKYGKADAA